MNMEVNIDRVRFETDRDMVTTVTGEGSVTGLFGKQERATVAVVIDEKSLRMLQTLLTLG